MTSAPPADTGGAQALDNDAHSTPRRGHTRGRATAAPLVWMRAIRDAGPPSTTAGAVLYALALRMRADGSGFAASRQLGADARVTTRTVTRALRWAREAGYLERTRRGHRVTTDAAVASEWQLTTPAEHERADR